ncbi:hypothetical protein AVEN_179070-1 [Araneus ventricosus]|uniref:Uncharacterized protein n=1 Tax=Araneus ventricosus TaxID=182803 RepID=A0A4Y2PNA6_ARAVE|nr:hypothetical protein AVEN_179070-1 [Araneus ventricosus]
MTRRSQRIANDYENPKFSITLLQFTLDYRSNDGFWSDANEIPLGSLRECPASVLWWKSLESEVLSCMSFCSTDHDSELRVPPKNNPHV